MTSIGERYAVAEPLKTARAVESFWVWSTSLLDVFLLGATGATTTI